MLRVAFVGTFSAHFVEPVRARLELPCDIVLADEDAIVPRLADVDVLVTIAFSREMGAVARRLKLVQVPGAGLDRIDRSALPAGTRLANAYGHEAGIAEYILGAMLALRRELSRLDAALRRGQWASQWAVGAPAPAPWPELARRTLSILGHGRIGRELARRARAFDMEVLAVGREAGPAGVDEAVARADYLALTLPLTPETHGLLGEKRLRSMKASAILVNVSRAQIVDEAALYASLAERRIAGAALDVWYRYPTEPGVTLPATQPFHELANVLLTPHVSGWTDGMLERRAELIAENIRRTARGEPPANLVAPPA